MLSVVSCGFKGPSVTGGGACFTLQGGGCRRPQPVGCGSSPRKNTKWRMKFSSWLVRAFVQQVSRDPVEARGTRRLSLIHI
eukprot:12714840-Alexandrium_andersonii.AAC.1